MELKGLQTQEYVVLPNLPTFPILLQSLLHAYNRLLHFILPEIARGYVAPALRVLIIDWYGRAKCENGVFPIFASHVCAPERKPGVLVQPVDAQGLLEALNRLFEVALEEMVPAQTAHGSRKFEVGAFPGFYVKGVVSLDITKQAEDAWGGKALAYSLLG